MIDEINRRTAEMAQQGQPSVLIVSAEVRLPLRRFLEPSFPRMAVLSFNELPGATEVENAGIITLPAHLAKADAVLKAAA